MRVADAFAFVGLTVVLLAVALQLTGRNEPEVRVTPVSVVQTTVASVSGLDGT